MLSIVQAGCSLRARRRRARRRRARRRRQRGINLYNYTDLIL